MYWLQNPDNIKASKDYGFGKDHLKCNDIGHVWISQFDNETYDIHYFCFNCATENKQAKKHIFRLPPTLPIWQYSMYGVNIGNA